MKHRTSRLLFSLAVYAAAFALSSIASAEIFARASELKNTRQQISELVAAKKYDDILKIARRLSSKGNDPKLFEYYDGWVSAKRGDHERAVQCYDRYLKLKFDPSIQALKSASLSQLAIQCLTSIFDDHNEKFDQLFLQIASAGHVGILMTALEDELAKHPTEQRIAAWLAFLSAEQGALATYRKAIAVVSRESDEYKLLEATYLIQTGNTKEAIPVLAGLRKKRNVSIVSVTLAMGLANRKFLDKAKAMNEEARVQKPNLPLAILNDAIMSYERRRWSQCLQELSLFHKQYGIESTSLGLKVRALVALGREREAGTMIVASYGLKDQSAAYFTVIGKLSQDVAKPAQAFKAFDRSIELDPANAEAYFARAKLEYDLWLFEDSAKDCQRALSNDPHLVGVEELQKKLALESGRSKSRGLSSLAQYAEHSVVQKLQPKNKQVKLLAPEKHSDSKAKGTASKVLPQSGAQ
jgi:tetratricopeptide (TPR) repeat protein